MIRWIRRKPPAIAGSRVIYQIMELPQNAPIIFKTTQKGVECEVFRITPDKRVIVAKGYDVDDAARAFWRSVKGLASGEWTVEGVSDRAGAAPSPTLKGAKG